MAPAALLVLLAAGAEVPERLVVIDIATADKTAQRVAAQVSEQLLTEASRVPRFRVIGQSDVAVLLGVERQKQLLGCADDASSCAAELAGALDARWLLTGTLGRLGKKYRLDLKVLDTRSSLVTQRAGATLSSPEEVLEALPALVSQLLSSLPEPAVVGPVEPPAPDTPPVEVARPAPRSVPVAPLVLGGAGVAAVAVGGVLLGTAKAAESAWATTLPTLSYAEAQGYAASAQTRADVGVGLLVAGSLAVAGAVVWYLLVRAPAPLEVALTPTGFFVGGAF